MSVRWLGCWMVGACLCSSPSWGADSAFRAAKPAFQRGMRSRTVADRVTALNKLSECPCPEAVEIVCKMGFADREQQVRNAARDVLAGFAGDPACIKTLLTQLSQSARRDGLGEPSYHLLWALGACKSREAGAAVAKFVDEHATTGRAPLLLVMTLIDDLAQVGDEHAFHTVQMLSGAKLFETRFGYRRCIVQALTKIPRVEAVDFLVDLLPKSKGQVQHDVVQFLTNLTRQSFADDDRLWTKWWAEHRETFQFPKALAQVNIDHNSPTYYGIPICAKRIVFVLDTSASMIGAPMEAAKIALIETLKKLPAEVYFSIVPFDGTVRVWNPKMVPATDAMKRDATDMVRAQEVRLGTASKAALEAAFQLDPEAIYFLSDGAPTDGTPEGIVHDISAENRIRRVSLHAIGIGTDRRQINVFREFMQSLARDNWGQYQGVDDGG